MSEIKESQAFHLKVFISYDDIFIKDLYAATVQVAWFKSFGYGRYDWDSGFDRHGATGS